MALLYRHSPHFVGKRSTPTEPALRTCSSCAITTTAPNEPPSPPIHPPPYSRWSETPPPSTPNTPTSFKEILTPPTPTEWRSHDHPTIFVRCAGHVQSSAAKKVQRRGTGVEAGVGVSFGSTLRYDLCESVPINTTAGDLGLRKMGVTPNRAELFAAIRALDRVKGILAAACRDRSDGGWDLTLGGMALGGKRRLAPGVTLPGKVEEVVVLTRSEYLISSITASDSQKPWRSTPAGQRRFPAPDVSTRGWRNASFDSVRSNVSRVSSVDASGQPVRRARAWLPKKSAKARKADFDLFFELDLSVQELADRYGVTVYFHKAICNEAAKLAQKGARKEEEEF